LKNKEVSIVADEFLAWLQFAIEGEDKGLVFYKRCSETVTDKRAKDLFDWLIPQEELHKKRLFEHLSQMAGNDSKKVKDSVEHYNKLGKKHDIFDEDTFKQITDQKTLVLDLFNIAAGLEKKAINLYLELEEKSEGKELKTFFHELAKQEMRHKKEIERKGMDYFGMEPEEEGIDEEKELRSMKTVLKEITITARSCTFEPQEIIVDKGDTIILKIKSIDCTAGFRLMAYDIDEFVSNGKESIMQFKADTAGEFEYYSNVPCSKGNAKMKGKLIVKGVNEPDD
jgi:cytochrome c oxidase subunit II